MELYCCFESNSEALRSIWDAGSALFCRLTEGSDVVPLAASSPYGFLAYLRAYLILVGDREGARRLLQDACTVVTEAGVDADALYLFPLTVSYYVEYTEDTLFISDLLDTVERAIGARAIPFPTGDFHRDALYLGAQDVLYRLRSAAGAPAEVAPRAHLADLFHSRYYDARSACYRDERGEVTPYSILLPLIYGFGHPNGRDAVRRYLIEEAFFTPRELRVLLLDAMAGEELFDLLLPSVLEGGLPRGADTAVDLYGIVAVVSHLCGVDMTMLGQGIHAASPHLPQGVTYRLTLPAAHTFLDFESEEYPGALVY